MEPVEQMKKINEIYLSKLSRYIFDKDTSFKHITKNLLNNLTLITMSVEDFGKPWQEIKKIYVKNAFALYHYFRLLEQYSEYKEAETSTLEGFFPDVSKVGNTGTFSYVEESLRRLEGKVI